MSKGIAKSHIQPPLSTKNQKLNQSTNKTLLPNKSAFKKKVEEEKGGDDDMEVAVVSENPTDMINDW